MNKFNEWFAHHPENTGNNKLFRNKAGMKLAWEAAKMSSEIKSKYFELLYAVATKFPGETRHETALRYIQQAENKFNDSVEQGHNLIGNPYPEPHDEGGT